MVFFTCDGCNETLKKNQVDAHAGRCRRCDSVSCVDCSISFYGDDFRAHTSCSMTEVDNLVAARGQKSKKLSPQEAWMELLNSSVATAPPAIKNHLEQMVLLDNVPRKEKQFRNFASNSLNLRGGHAQKILDAIWNHLNEQREQQKQLKAKAAAEQEAKKEQQQSAEEKEKKKETTTPEDESSLNNVSDTDNHNSTNNKKEENDEQQQKSDDKAMYKNVKKATKKLLKKAPGHSMKYKSLQKALREKIGAPKQKVKEMMTQVVANESKKFMLEGKQIKLVVD